MMRENLDVLITKFQEYCEQRKNLVYTRNVFFERNQQPNENIDNDISAIYVTAQMCTRTEEVAPTVGLPTP